MTRIRDESFDAILRTVAASPNVTIPPQGTIAERFALRRTMGEGAFGTVYEAEDLRGGGRVALKMLRSAQPDWLYRFKHEFRAMQGLSHPNLVRLDELFFSNDRWFFTMELINGLDIVSYMRASQANMGVGSTIPSGDTARRPSERARQPHAASFDGQRLRDILRQLLEGLAALHAAGKVHRDVKPSNVMVTPEGRVVVLDFGLVMETSHAPSLALVGTPEYMAPEQAALASEVTPAADLYSVGVMLYEILTGRMPIEGRFPAVLIEKQTRRPAPPSSIEPSIPEDLNALCVKLLHFDPTMRPSVSEALQSLVVTQISSSTPRCTQADATAFVGRTAELDRLRAAFEASRRGEPATLLVCGESGIGKSSLIRRFTDQLMSAHPDTTLLEGRCYEREAVPYKAIDGIIDVLSRRLSRMPEANVAALLPARSAALARVFPVMLRVPLIANDHANFVDNVEPYELRRRAFVGLRECLTRIATRGPTVVVIDDLQWADNDGVRALAEILRPPDAPPLLVIGTLRTSPGDGDSPRERLRMVFPGGAHVLELSNLSHEEATAFAAQLLMRDSALAADPEKVARESGGHPLFLEELARHVVSRGSACDGVKLDDAIASRVAQFDPHTRRLVELIAVAGKPLSQGLFADVLAYFCAEWPGENRSGVALLFGLIRVDPGEFTRSVALLRASNLVRTSGTSRADAIEPYHDRITEAVLASLDSAQRRTLHAALAIGLSEGLETRGGSRDRSLSADEFTRGGQGSVEFMGAAPDHVSIVGSRKDGTEVSVVIGSRKDEIHVSTFGSTKYEIVRVTASAPTESATPDFGAVATHWREAYEAPQAARYAEKAGDQASRALAFDCAVQWYRQARALLPDDDANLDMKLGDAIANAVRVTLAAPE